MAVRDSAGIRIVEYPGVPEAARSLRLSEQPVYRHGARPGDRLFARVQMGALRPDGSAVLVDIGSGPGGTQEVLELMPDGALGGVLARGGQGPQEVRSVQSLQIFGGDSLLIEDRGNVKLMVFSGNTHVRNVSLQSRPDLGRALGVRGVGRDGSLLMTTSLFSVDFTEPWLPGSLVRLDLGTLASDTVAAFDMTPRRDPQGRLDPFMARGIPAVSGGRFVYLRNDTPELKWLASNGEVEQIVRWNPERVPATEDLLAGFREAQRRDIARLNPTMDGASLNEFVERQAARLHVPPGTVLPLALTMSGDDQGRVWLSDYQVTPTSLFYYSASYDVVDADGIWLGRVQMPARFRLLAVAGDRVLGVQLDELDVEHVVVYELIEG